jgi:glyoxylase-like metal-dependent hydrolase (beta-lactamase superfamily II)/rhodanese-related sulfurtransferase
VFFKQVVDEDLGCASYLVGDERTGEAAVVDPAYAVEPYLTLAERGGVRIGHVLETHTHADHVSGHGRLALEHGARVHVHPDAGPAFPFEPLEDGSELVLGDVAIRVVHTPGHRPEHCCFAVTDRARADAPWLVLTGDSLFVGDVARPDLAIAAGDGARALFGSLRRLLELDDGVEVYPGHVAGSLCGAGMSSKTSTTIGFERRFNHALRVSDEVEFVAESSVVPPRPPNMERIVELNRGPFLGAPPALPELREPGGAAVLDVRPARAFAEGHLPGAISVPVSGSSFATRAAFVLVPDEPLALHASSPEEADRAARGLRKVGYIDELAGVLAGAGATERLAPVGLDELAQLDRDHAVLIVDVREREERDGGYIAGSRHIPFRLAREFAGELRNGKPVVTICESGARAAIAASVLAHEGVDARPVLDGGMDDWGRAGNGTVCFRRCGTA